MFLTNKTEKMKNRNLAKRVKELRNRKGFSQEILAEESGLSLRTIQRIENEETEPTGETLKKLANALNVNPDDLIDWTIKEDKSYLKALNLSALTFLIFPILGILIPTIMRVSKKDKIKGINKIAKDLINFEITWFLLLFAIPILLNLGILASHGELSMRSIISSSLIFIVVMYILNVIFIFINTFKIHSEMNVKYFPKIKFLRN